MTRYSLLARYFVLQLEKGRLSCCYTTSGNCYTTSGNYNRQLFNTFCMFDWIGVHFKLWRSMLSFKTLFLFYFASVQILLLINYCNCTTNNFTGLYHFWFLRTLFAFRTVLHLLVKVKYISWSLKMP